MNPLASEQLAQAHYQELVQLAQSDWQARSLQPVRPWRRMVSEALVRAAVGIGLPPTRRPVVLREARALLADERCCA